MKSGKEDQTGIYKLEMETLQSICSSIGTVSTVPNRQGGLWALDAKHDKSTEEVSFLMPYLMGLWIQNRIYNYSYDYV